MKYKDLIDNVSKFEEEYGLPECIYFEAIEELGEVQKDIRKLDDVRHIRRIIRLFLINWGGMSRVVAGKKVLRKWCVGIEVVILIHFYCVRMATYIREIIEWAWKSVSQVLNIYGLVIIMF